MKHIITLFFATTLLTACVTNGPGSHLAGNQQTDTEMGVRYLFGRGVPQNDKTAFQYFKVAADKGDAFAQSEVAFLYAAGKGTEQDYEKSLFYYQLAAYQNLASAQFNLGLMYAKGLGTQVSQEDALRWIRKSATRGFGPAKQYLKNAHTS